MHAAESKRAKWPTGFFVVCTKNLKKKCKLKFCSMFLLIRKPRGNVQPSPLRKSARRALVSDDVNLGNTFGRLWRWYLQVVCLQVCELTFTSLPNNKAFCTKSSLLATSHTKALLFKIRIASWQQKSLLELKTDLVSHAAVFVSSQMVAWETIIDYDRLYLPCLVSDLGDNGADNDCWLTAGYGRPNVLRTFLKASM